MIIKQIRKSLYICGCEQNKLKDFVCTKDWSFTLLCFSDISMNLYFTTSNVGQNHSDLFLLPYFVCFHMLLYISFAICNVLNRYVLMGTGRGINVCAKTTTSLDTSGKIFAGDVKHHLKFMIYSIEKVSHETKFKLCRQL